MISDHVSREVPLEASDLRNCQDAFDEICLSFGAEKTTDRARRIAATVIEFYRQGVRDRSELVRLTKITQQEF